MSVKECMASKNGVWKIIHKKYEKCQIACDHFNECYKTLKESVK